jgi:hypothetical protein
LHSSMIDHIRRRDILQNIFYCLDTVCSVKIMAVQKCGLSKWNREIPTKRITPGILCRAYYFCAILRAWVDNLLPRIWLPRIR